MPRWDFECPECGQVVEDVSFVLPYHPDMADYTVPMPKCGPCEVPMQKRPSAPALSFKGPGWTPKHYGGKS